MRVRVMYIPMLLASSNKVSFKLVAVQTAKDDGVRFWGGPKASSFMGALEADGPEFDDEAKETAGEMSVEEAADTVFGDGAKPAKPRKPRAEKPPRRETAAVRPTPVADQGGPEEPEEVAEPEDGGKEMALDVV
jgi:hypothetical protein